MRWRFVFQGRQADARPPGTHTRTDLLPQAVELELELDHVGTVSRPSRCAEAARCAPAWRSGDNRAADGGIGSRHRPAMVGSYG